MSNNNNNLTQQQILEEFESYHWEGDEKWKEYVKRVEIPSGNESAILERLKRKYYQKNINSNFDVNSTQRTTSSSSTSSSDERPQYSSSNNNNARNNSASSRDIPNTSNYGNIYQHLPTAFSVWLFSHALLVICSILYFVPLGNDFNYQCYKLGMLCAAVGYGTALYSAIGIPRMDQQSLQRVILNENSHYLLLSIILIATNPLFLILIPLATYSLYHVVGTIVSYPAVPSFVHVVNQKLNASRAQITLGCAYLEVMTVFYLVLNFFLGTGSASLLQILGFYWFISLRQLTSMHTRTVLGHIGSRLNSFFLHPQMPSMIQRGYTFIRNYLRSRVSPEARQQ